MYQFEILESIEPKAWNENLKESQYANFFQTFEYLNFQTEEGNSPIFINILDEGRNVKGQLGLIVHQSAIGRSSIMMNKIIRSLPKLGKRASWVSGPIIHETDKKQRLQILKTTLKALDKLIEEKKFDIVDGYTSPQDYGIDKEYKNQFNDFGYQLQNFFTFVTDLNQNIKNIWDGIHNSTRRDVMRAQKRNVVIKELNSFDELEDYFLLGQKWAKTKGMQVKPSPKLLEEYWKVLKLGVEKVFLSFQDDELVASHRLGCFNHIVYSHKLTNSYSRPSNVGGPILTWYAIEWAKKCGIRLYDFSGGESPPINKKENIRYLEQWESLLNYKRKWGGKEYPYYHMIKVQSNFRYKLSRILTKSDWMMRNYKHKQFKRTKKMK